MRATRSIMVLALAVGGASSQKSWAGAEVDVSKSAARDGIVRIANVRGEIDIEGWDRPEVRVRGEIDDLAEDLEFRVQGDETLIRVEISKLRGMWGDGSDLEIRVPSGSRLEIDGVSTEIEVDGVAGILMIRSVSGDVDIRGAESGAEINTVSGDVDLDGGSGRTKVVTVSGEITVDGNATEVSVNAVSGDVELNLGAFDNLRATTVNGSVSVDGRLNSDGHIRAESVNGELTIRLDDPVDVRIDAHAGPGGEIDNSLTRDEPRDVFPNQMELRSGDGSALIEVSTVNGEINLKRG